VLDINTYDLFNSVMKYFRLNIICIHHKDQRKKEANLGKSVSLAGFLGQNWAG
jgi:hypothetical protein